MSKNIRSFIPLMLLVGSVSLLGASAALSQVVEVKIEPDGVYFVPTGEFGEGGLLLTVSGPEDCFLEQAYEPGKVAEFGIRDAMGEIIPDGSYSYQVTHRPVLSREHQEILAKARVRNDPKEIKELKRKGIVRERYVDSGYLTVFRGRFVYEQPKEEQSKKSRALVTERAPFGGFDQQNGEDGLVSTQLADFVIIDDLIVDGSACIGFDCVNGESFGFDTVRLKENNLRIKFDDTSVAASFPRNDWQLTANDSANGGASKFSIDDVSGGRTPFTVEANARSHSLYVDDGGRIGSRTSTPSTEIHTIDGDTPTLRLQQDGSSGFAPQTWDVAGNETNYFIRDVTNGSQLPFRIRPDAPTNSIFVDVDGSVGLGTASPEEKLHLSGGAPQTLLFDDSSVADARWFLGNAGDDSLKISADGTGAVEARFSRNGDLTIRGDLIKSGAGTYNFPDYVFDPRYDLRSLDELREFIARHRHLPGVMSESEVENADGFGVAELQLQMLEKIEELTLYVLQQDERLNEQASEIARLKHGATTEPR